MLVGYMRVSKADGSQTTDPQRDALREAGVDEVCGAPRDRCPKARLRRLRGRTGRARLLAITRDNVRNPV